jgi:oligopeptide transport system substrate-binding protein
MKKEIVMIKKIQKKLLSILIIPFIISGLLMSTQAFGMEKVLKIALGVELYGLDHQIVTDGETFTVLGSSLEGLLQHNANHELIPALAESWKVSSDGMVYTFKLRKKAKWSNGEPITAHDFVFAWRRMTNPETGAEYVYLLMEAGIKNVLNVMMGKMKPEAIGARALDDHTLEVTLGATVPYFLSFLTLPNFAPVNQKFYEAQGKNYAMTTKNVLSSGAFTLGKWQPGYGIVAEKNEHYWDANNVKLDRIEWRVMKDHQTSVLEYEAGNLHVVRLSSELVTLYNNNPGFSTVKEGFMWYLQPNFDTEKEELKNKNFRKALSHSFDKAYIVDSIMNNGSIAADYWVAKDYTFDSNRVDYRDTVGDFKGYDVPFAQAAYKKAKKELGESRFELELLYDDDTSLKEVCEFVKSEWETNLPGIHITLKAQPKKNRLDLMKKDNYDVALTRWGPDWADPQVFLFAHIKNGFGNSGYDSKEYNILYKRIAAGGDLSRDDRLKERWQTMIEAEKLLFRDVVFFPAFQGGSAYLTNPKVKNIQRHITGQNVVYKNATIH